ncbi:MAG: hypothetical protein QM809_01105 [Gordonia sp. (in: high G+C Gram-positive bacteria)]|uniref:hypothetical protein n=1 Tax=Gordonia sp. (in: high G+C Gram-positive bacteria) TaxID=84139 RepID=UPI0039E26642
MTRSPSRTVDYLIHEAHEIITAAIAAENLPVDLDHECGDDCDTCDRLDWLSRAAGSLDVVLSRFDRYSDGRPISGTVEYQHGRTFAYTFPAADPVPGERELTRFALAPFDEGMPSPGQAVIYADDHAGTLRVDLLPGNVIVGRFNR